MDAIKKKMQAMKMEKDAAMDRSDALEAQNKETNGRAEKADDEVHNLQKRLQTLENDLDQVSEALLKANTQLVEKDKALQNAEGEVAALNRRIQLLEEDLERSEERLNTATTKLAEASQAADESERSVSPHEEDRADQLMQRISDVGREVEALFATLQAEQALDPMLDL